MYDMSDYYVVRHKINMDPNEEEENSVEFTTRVIQIVEHKHSVCL